MYSACREAWDAAVGVIAAVSDAAKLLGLSAARSKAVSKACQLASRLLSWLVTLPSSASEGQSLHGHSSMRICINAAAQKGNEQHLRRSANRATLCTDNLEPDAAGSLFGTAGGLATAMGISARLCSLALRQTAAGDGRNLGPCLSEVPLTGSHPGEQDEPRNKMNVPGNMLIVLATSGASETWSSL